MHDHFGSRSAFHPGGIRSSVLEKLNRPKRHFAKCRNFVISCFYFRLLVWVAALWLATKRVGIYFSIKLCYVKKGLKWWISKYFQGKFWFINHCVVTSRGLLGHGNGGSMLFRKVGNLHNITSSDVLCLRCSILSVSLNTSCWFLR
jgi:hypothetical protein